MNRVIGGGIAGLAATATMSVVVFGANKVGLMEVTPPKKITKRAEQKVGKPPRQMSHEQFTASWLIAHVSYGTGAGVAFGLGRPLIPGSPLLKGLLYGGALWAISYLKVMPALGLYPPPQRASISSTVVMIVAHAVYGTTLAECEHRLS